MVVLAEAVWLTSAGQWEDSSHCTSHDMIQAQRVVASWIEGVDGHRLAVSAGSSLTPPLSLGTGRERPWT